MTQATKCQKELAQAVAGKTKDIWNGSGPNVYFVANPHPGEDMPAKLKTSA